MSEHVQVNAEGFVNVNAAGRVIVAAGDEPCCCLGGWHVALRCGFQDGGPPPEGEPGAIYFRVGFLCDGCAPNAGRVLVVGGLCYAVAAEPGPVDEPCASAPGGVQHKALIIDALPDGAFETQPEYIVCKDRSATCDDAECVPIGERDCCLRVPTPAVLCRCMTDHFGPCELGQLVRVTWTYFERGRSWCTSAPGGDPSDCVQTDEETFEGDGVCVGVYECISGDSGLGLLVSWEGSVRRKHTNSYCAEAAPAYDDDQTWVPPSAIFFGTSISESAPLPYHDGQFYAHVGNCCGSCQFGWETAVVEHECEGFPCTTRYGAANGGFKIEDAADDCRVSFTNVRQEIIDSSCSLPRCNTERVMSATVVTLERCRPEGLAPIEDETARELALRKRFAVEDLLR